MVICKFYQQGKCKFGNRCYNEHVRESDGGFQDRNRGEQQSRSGYGRNQNYRSENQYQERRQDDYGYGRNRNQGRYEKYDRQERHDYGNQNDYTSPFTRNNTHQQARHNTNQDRFHWNKNQANRFIALSNAPAENNFTSGEAEDDSIVNAIQAGMKTWVESGMWPYSCYFHPKAKKCIEGLPDIQPEELRVLYLLHGEGTYKSLIEQVDMMYNKRKDELFVMMNDTKQSVLSDLHNSLESNPSSCLTIQSMYGPGVDFNAKGSTTVPGPQSPVTQATNAPPQQATPATPPAPSFPSQPGEPAQTGPNPPVTAPTQAVAVANIFRNAPPASAAPQAADKRYTDRSLLSDEELQQFEQERFTLGEIPTRPPPKEMCR